MHPQELIAAYRRGENIIALLKEGGVDKNNDAIIETAYDLQTGSYVKALGDPNMLHHKEAYGAAIAEQVQSLTEPTSILEAGVGEGTTLSFVLDGFGKECPEAHGFDISWSRIACCREWLIGRGHNSVVLSVASLLHLPYLDDSFDVVYTSHTIEPNGGNEPTILKELYRITSRYLVLLEPGYELASDEAQQRMETHGYCRGLVRHSEELGMEVVKHELFPHTSNPLNPTAITVIAKNAQASPVSPTWACTHFGDRLIDHGDSLYSNGSLRAYPKVGGIPCLRPKDGIIASAYEKYLQGE